MSNWVILNEGTAQESLENPSTGHWYRQVPMFSSWKERYDWVLCSDFGQYEMQGYLDADYQLIKANLLARGDTSNRNSNMDDIANMLVDMLEQDQSQNNEQPTLRDMFAMSALEGIMAAWGKHDVTDFNEISCEAYNLADAMLKEREK